MNKKLCVLAVLRLTSFNLAEAQQPKIKIRHVAFLSGASVISTQTRVEAFRQGLRTLGYIAGNNIAIEWRFAEGNFDRLASLAVEHIQRKVDVIVVAGGEPVAFAAKRATQTIPIITANAFDPIRPAW